MKKNKIVITVISLILCLAALNSCEQAPQNNSNESALKGEIEQLKQKLDSQAELISSLLSSKEEEIKKDENTEESNDNTEDKTAECNTVSTDFQYIKENGGVTITKYVGKQTSVRIPEKIENLSVLKIGKNAFADTEVRSVTLPSCCEYVDWFAFYGCYGLTTVYISENVSEIGYAAFDGCSKKLTIYCPSDSYAEKYAKSFGIAFSIIS